MSPNNPINPRASELADLLRQIKEVLDECNIPFWLECGTLLWAVRDQSFSPVAKDLDLSSWIENEAAFKTKAAPKFKKRGFKIWICPNHHIDIKKENSGLWADVVFYRPSAAKAIYPNLCPKKNFIGKVFGYTSSILSAPFHQEVDRQKPFLNQSINIIFTYAARLTPSFIRVPIAKALSLVYQEFGSYDASWVVPARYFKNLNTINFCGIKVNTPRHVSEYLAYRYGYDWQTPKNVTSWETFLNDGAVLANPNYKLKLRKNILLKNSIKGGAVYG